MFKWFFLGRFVSLFGSAMSPIALAFAVLEASNSARDMSLILASTTIPMVVFALVGGVIGDRYSRRLVLMVTNLGACLSQAMVVLMLASGHFDVRLLSTLAFVNGCLTSASQPALRGILPEIVPRNLLRKANSLLGSARNTARVFGPSVSTVIVARFGGQWAIAFDSASFLIATICLAQLRTTAAVMPARNGVLIDLRLGWSEFTSRTWVWSVVTSFAFTNCLYVGVWTVLGPLIARQTFGIAGWGFVLSANAAGMLISSVTMYRLRVARLLPVGLVGVSLLSFPMMGLGLRLNLAALVMTALVAGIGTGVFGVAWETSIQEHIPSDLISRVSSFDNMGSFVAIPLGQLAAAPLGTALGYTKVALYGGVLCLGLALSPLTVSSVRKLRHTADT